MWSVIHAKTTINLEDKGPPPQFGSRLEQFYIPCQGKAEVKEGNCFHIRTQKRKLESHLILPCACHVETRL